MAEGQTFKDRDISEAPLDEEDPLMELSRIIGLEPRRESIRTPIEAAPEYHPEPVDIVEEPELAIQPELSADLQRDLADELIARLEADSELSLDPEPVAEAPVEEADVYIPEAAVEVASVAAVETPVDNYDPATPHMPVSQAASVSLEDELEAILNPHAPRATPFGLRPVSEETEPVELRAPEIDSHLDMNFDAEPVEVAASQAEWAPESPGEFEPLPEAELEVADEHYEAVEPYVAEGATARSWPPVTTGIEPDYEPDTAAAEEGQPILETVTHEPRAIEATDEFEVPEFEYENAEVPPAADDPLASYGNEFEPVEYAKPNVTAAAPSTSSYDQRQLNDADFDQINQAIAELEGERDNTGATIGAAGLGVAAATAASARPGRKEFVLNENDEFAAGLDVPHAPKPAARQTSVRSYLMAAGLGTLALVGGIAAYAWTRGPDGAITTAAPVVLKADIEPVKVAPENPGGKVVPNQDIAVYDKVAGAEQPSGEPQTVLVSKTEEPVDLAAKATARVVLPGPSAAEPEAANPVEDVAKAEDRAPVSSVEDASPAQGEIASVAAKKVRTMVVKSDGSLVERPVEATKPVETAAAADQDLMKSMADAAVPATKVQTKPVVAQEEVGAVAKPAEPAAETVAAVAPVETEATTAADTPETTAVAEPEAPAKPVVKTVKTKKITQKKQVQEQPQEVAAATNIPLVDARPADQPVNIVGKTGKTPNAGALAEAAAAVVAEPTAPAASGGGYVVQIASAPSPDQAQSTYTSLNRKFGKIIGGRDMNIVKADIPGRGTFYRVRIAAGSKKEAAALCAKYKSAGGQCLVAR
jgi:SPOR domain